MPYVVDTTLEAKAMPSARIRFVGDSPPLLSGRPHLRLHLHSREAQVARILLARHQ